MLRENLTERFSQNLPAQYHYTKLQDATQEKGENVEEFADRCRGLCLKTIRNVADEATQRIINEEAERRLVAAYINGLGGVVGQQVRFRMPLSLEDAVQVAVIVSNVEGMRAQYTKRVFSAKKDNSSQGVTCFNCGKRGHYARDCRAPKRDNNPARDSRTNNTATGRRQTAPNQASRNSSASGNTSGKQIRCFYCKKLGHRKDQCPQLMGNNSVPPKQSRVDSKVPEADPGTTGEPVDSSLGVGASGNELLLEVQVEGELHRFLIVSGASLSLVKPGFSRAEIKPTDVAARGITGT
jgi:hypothetical protein